MSWDVCGFCCFFSIIEHQIDVMNQLFGLDTLILVILCACSFYGWVKYKTKNSKLIFILTTVSVIINIIDNYLKNYFSLSLQVRFLLDKSLIVFLGFNWRFFSLVVIYLGTARKINLFLSRNILVIQV